MFLSKTQKSSIKKATFKIRQQALPNHPMTRLNPSSLPDLTVEGLYGEESTWVKKEEKNEDEEEGDDENSLKDSKESEHESDDDSNDEPDQNTNLSYYYF